MNITLDNQFATFSISKNLLHDPVYCREPNSHAEKRAKLELGLLFTSADPTKPISVLRKKPVITSYILGSKKLHFESEIEDDDFETHTATPLWWMKHLGVLNCRIGNIQEYMLYSFAVVYALCDFGYSIDESWRIVCSEYVDIDSKLESIIKDPKFAFPEFLKSKFYTPVILEGTEPQFWLAKHSVYQSIEQIIEIDAHKKTKTAPFAVKRR